MTRVAIIGAGHNGLVTACYLARAGHEVSVFEKRDIVGGCCATDETTFPGFKISSAAYVNSLFLPQIVEDLNLKDYGYEVLPRNPSSFTPLLDGRYLMIGRDLRLNIRQIRKFSERDAKAYVKYEKMLDKIAKFIDPTLTMTAPNIPPKNWSDIKKIAYLNKGALGLGPSTLLSFIRLMTQGADRVLDSWFESEPLKATLLTDSAIGAVDFNGYVLLHHVMGEGGGGRGFWGYQKGGMGGIAHALAEMAKKLGVRIYTGTGVNRISLSEGNSAIRGLVLHDEFYPVDMVVSNADPKTTIKLCFTEFPDYEYASRILKTDYRCASMKVNLTLSGLPNFRCLPGTKPGPQHMGTIHLSPSMDYVRRAADEGRKGWPSYEPILEITIPSVIDDTLAPKGCHVMNIFVQYTPYNLARLNVTWDDIKKGYFYKNIMGVMRKYISNIDEIITGVQILSPLDLERDFNLTEGNIFHGAMNLNQLFSFRPISGYADYRTPLKGLYLCGAGTHPGGGVVGANGYNAAREIIKDLNGSH